VLATITGLAALLHTSAVAFQVLKYAGAAYLLWMAWATLRDTDAIVLRPESGAPSAGRVIRSAILLNTLNPKLTIFFFAFLPQFVPAGEPHSVPRMIGLSGVFMLLTFVVFALYGCCAASVRRHVISRPRVMTWIRRVFAGSFVGLGLTLAVTDR
jgi:threonine/homoserine/homoserine lactone efflux protein